MGTYVFDDRQFIIDTLLDVRYVFGKYQGSVINIYNEETKHKKQHEYVESMCGSSMMRVGVVHYLNDNVSADCGCRMCPDCLTIIQSSKTEFWWDPLTFTAYHHKPSWKLKQENENESRSINEESGV